MQERICYSQIVQVPVRGYPYGMVLQVHVRELRKERGMTIAELAEMIGVSTPHMSQVERGVKNLNNHLLTRIAEALRVTPDVLISGQNRSDIAALLRSIEQLDKTDRVRVQAFVDALSSSKPEPEQSE